jgi:hypothetical protein
MLDKIFVFLWRVILFALFTLMSQVGGLIYLLHLLLFAGIQRHFKLGLWTFWARKTGFCALYLIITFTAVPWLAAKWGRVPLPITQYGQLKPANRWTCILNRHYVKPELLRTTYGVAQAMAVKYPGNITNYLEANFPFFDGYPLWPHLSHNDGEKLDLSFFYVDRRQKVASDRVPAWYGYGVCEEPLKNETDRPSQCARAGYWQYSFMKDIVPQQGKAALMFDAERTKTLVELFVAQPSIDKILIEPHLKQRLKLVNDKIRLHGCQAVRHDDHVHVQLK